MNKNNDSATRRQLLNNAGWALRTVWQTNPALMSGMLVFMLLRGMLPAGLALFARGLVNALVDLFGVAAVDISPVLPWLALGFVLTLAEALLPLAHKYSLSRLRDDVDIRVTGSILDHAATLDLAYFEDPASQRVIERAQQNTADRFTLFVEELFRFSTCLLQLVSLAGVLVYIEPLVLLVLGPIGLPYLLHQWRLARKRHGVEFKRSQKRRWSAYFVSQMTGRQALPETKLFNLAPLFIMRFRKLMTEFKRQDRQLYLKAATGGGIYATVATLAFYGLFFRIVARALEGGLTVGDVAVFGTASSRLRVTLEQLIVASSSVLEQTLYITDLRTFLQSKPLLLSPGNGDGNEPAPPAAGAVRFDSVSFTYPSAGSPTLKDLSFEIRPGEIVGLVGENGAGKTTLVKLLCRLYDVSEGRIVIDGHDVRLYEIRRLQQSISIVLQHFNRYEATVSENIAYGNWEALLDNEEAIRKAAESTGADELINTLPEGYDTLLGRMFGTHDLSGGQWQTLAAARALTRDACILVLDEPTAHLDARAEYALFEKFRKLARGRTTILISHRFSTLRMADRIMVLHEGCLIEDGSHEELIARAGHYADLYGLHRKQFDHG